MVGVGIIAGVDDFEFTLYSREELRNEPPIVDTERLAKDAEQRLRIPEPVAVKVFQVELEFLRMRGTR